MAFIPVDRSIVTHWIYRDAEYLKVWLTMSIEARYTEGEHLQTVDGDTVTTVYGQFVYGRGKWSERTGVSEQRLRTFVKRLENEGMLVLVKQYRKCSVYFLPEYGKFNRQATNRSTNESTEDQPTDQPADQPADQPTDQPTESPIEARVSADKQPTDQPADQPADQPTDQPQINQQINPQINHILNKDFKKVLEKVKKEPKEKDLNHVLVPAQEIIDYMNKLSGRKLTLTDEAKKLITARWKQHSNFETFKHVIDVRWAEVQRRPETKKWFNNITPFRPENFALSLTMEVEDMIEPRKQGRTNELFVQAIKVGEQQVPRMSAEELGAARAMAQKLDERLNGKR
jgi:uncharacterized phage protein (TIGR02220 family)